MTEKTIKQFLEAFNNELISQAGEQGIEPTADNETLIILCDTVLTSLCKKESLELRKFIITIPHKDQETGENKELETGFLITDKSGQALQLEISDLSEIQGSRIGTSILSNEELKGAISNIYPENNIEHPITEEFIKYLKEKYKN